MACSNPLVSSITIDDFKSFFFKDFNYLPTWIAATYNSEDVVFYTVNKKSYQANKDNITSLPTTINDWTLLKDISSYVLDQDIDRAFSEACPKFNNSLFGNNDSLKIGWLCLAAHFLVSNLKSGGLDGSAPGFSNSRSVGSVSESLTIPDWMTSNPAFSFLSTTYYGLKYLNIIQPYLIGNVAAIYGGTSA
jgi:hypothetical protein